MKQSLIYSLYLFFLFYLLVESKLIEDVSSKDPPLPGNGIIYIYLQKPSNWASATPYIHYKSNSASWTSVPGHLTVPSTSKSEFPYSKGWYMTIIKANTLEFVFNDGNNNWMHSTIGGNFLISSPGIYSVLPNGELNTHKIYDPKCLLQDTTIPSPGYTVFLRKNQNKDSILLHLKLLEIPSSIHQKYGKLFNHLEFLIEETSKYELHVKCTTLSSRWEIPSDLFPLEHNSMKNSLKFGQNKQYSIQFSTTSKFFFEIYRTTTGERVFSTKGHDFVFSDQYIQISTSIDPTAKLYGLGESTSSNGLEISSCTRRALWASDTPSFASDKNLYGVHPFYLMLQKNKLKMKQENCHKCHEHLAFGSLLWNSNGMDITYANNTLTYQIIGGILDFYFFMGPTAKDVIEQYTNRIGKPAMMPYWSLGFHQCRWGYNTLEEIKAVRENYSKSGIPVETYWSDIEYMDSFRDFTWDPVNYPKLEMRKWVNELHESGQKWVPIVDPGMAIDKNYPAYSTGLDLNVFIKESNGIDQYLGQVWPGPTVFPDFLNPNASNYWMYHLKNMYNEVPFDGLWIDMNEIANFCTGQYCRIQNTTTCPNKWTCCLECKNGSTGFDKQYDYPIFTISNIGDGANQIRPLGARTVAMSALHHGNIREYNVHNLYGLIQAKTTYEVLKSLHPGQRPFVLSRSTFASSGKYTAHWTGDNLSSWNDLRWSIASLLQLGLFGIPMVGADICGFASDATEELCARWVALGAWYPFSRNHNAIGNIGQELYRWPSVKSIGRKVLSMRYRLLSHLYTLLYESHTNGLMVMRPLFFEFPDDPQTTESPAVDRQFFFGDSILVSPVLEKGAKSVRAYFPQGNWYHLYDHIQIRSKGEYFDLETDINQVQVHVREGRVIPMQIAASTTRETMQNPYELLVTLPSIASDSGHGKLFLDNGYELPAGDHSTMITYRVHRCSISASIAQDTYIDSSKIPLKKVAILGMMEKPKEIYWNNVTIPENLVTYDNRISSLSVLVDFPMNEEFQMEWKSSVC